MVNDLAGTTRDPIDEIIELGGYPWRFVDTAGIRRRQHMAKGASSTLRCVPRPLWSVLRCRGAAGCFEPISEQDVRIDANVIDSGRCAMVPGIQQVGRHDEDRRYMLGSARLNTDLAHVQWAPRVAKTTAGRVNGAAGALVGVVRIAHSDRPA